MKHSPYFIALCATVVAVSGARAFGQDDAKMKGAMSQTQNGMVIKTEHISTADATEKFKFKTVPVPSKTDAATTAKFSIVTGEQDGNGAGPEALHDGLLPSGEDVPDSNFFFNAGTDGGRIGVDLNKVIDIQQVNSYSWHPNTRGPQVYKVYGSDGTADGFKAKPDGSTEPTKVGWKLIASVDTRPKDGDPGGQYGVSIAGADGLVGHYRYLLFDIMPTEKDDDFGNTFYSEIDVVAK